MAVFSLDDEFPTQAKLIADLDHVIGHLCRMIEATQDHCGIDKGPMQDIIQDLQNYRVAVFNEVLREFAQSRHY